MTRPTISVVVPARNEAPTIAATLLSIRETLPSDGEIVVVDDGSKDGTASAALAAGARIRLLRSAGQLGVARARNFGASRASGKVLAFCDAHVLVGQGAWEALVEGLRDPRVGAVSPRVIGFGTSGWGYGMTMRSPDMDVEWLPPNGSTSNATHLCGCFTALTRETFDDVGGFDNGMLCWGWEDVEMSIRLWLMGYDLHVVALGDAKHLFRQVSPYRIDPIWALHNQLRLACVHFSEPRLQAAAALLRSHPLFEAAYSLCVRTGVWERRQVLFRHRCRNDDEYFELGDRLARRTTNGGG
jgi:glycosyltransferase involved in cell wall biosynthesis